jgi:CheY-like chemotaxis protein
MESPSPPPEAARPAPGKTVLIVEDNDPVRTYLKSVMERAGFSLLVARHGEEALGLCARHAGVVDLLVTDVVMPRMGGEDLARQLAVRYPLLKVLYVSGYPWYASELNGLLSPGLPFLQKPFHPDVLMGMVRELLGLAEVPSRAPPSGQAAPPLP